MIKNLLFLLIAVLGIVSSSPTASAISLPRANFVPDGRFLVFGENEGGQVSIFSRLGVDRAFTQYGTFLPFDASYRGGVTVGTGDVNGDGVADVVTGAATGVSQVSVFDGVTGGEIRSFLAYAPTFDGGVHVSVGDVDGDGFADIITGTGSSVSSTPHVKVFSGKTGAEIQSFFAYAANFHGGVNVAAGDINGDGKAEIVTGSGAGGGPNVKVFNGLDGSLLQSFLAFQPTFLDGIMVAVGDYDGDTKPDLIIGQQGTTPIGLRVFDALDPINMTLDTSLTETSPLGGLFIGSLGYTAGNLASVTDLIGPVTFLPFGSAYTGGINAASFNPIPEPTTSLLLLGSLGAVVFARRRNR